MLLHIEPEPAFLASHLLSKVLPAKNRIDIISELLFLGDASMLEVPLVAACIRPRVMRCILVSLVQIGT